MRREDRAAARQNLDNRLRPLVDQPGLKRPAQGWVRAVRNALGMTTAQLSKRLGISQPRAVALEKGEVEGSLTLASLERAAEALGCDLAYALVPRAPLQETVKTRARELATQKVSAIRNAMSAEGQIPDETAVDIDRLTYFLMDKRASQLWDDT